MTYATDKLYEMLNKFRMAQLEFNATQHELFDEISSQVERLNTNAGIKTGEEPEFNRVNIEYDWDETFERRFNEFGVNAPKFKGTKFGYIGKPGSGKWDEYLP